MKLVMELTKEEILRYLTLFEPLRDTTEFYEFIQKCNYLGEEINIIANDIPTYEEYFEEYKKQSKNLIKLHQEQTKALHNFEQWLDENKDKIFTYEELYNKLLELKLSYKGFNGEM